MLPRELLLRGLELRGLELRGLELRELVLRDFAAAPERDADERLDVEPVDFPRDELVFLVPEVDFFVREVDEPVRLLLVRDAPLPDFFAREPVEREPVERELVDLRAPPDLAGLARDALAPLLPPSSSPVHLPDMTRCAASATASAIREPSFVALDMTLLAATDAVSAASRPASRIFRRAAGLALIAAAAAARPAASISLLIAAFAILSVISFEPDERDFEEPEERDPEELFRADLAIVLSPSVAGKTLYGGNGSHLKSRIACECADVTRSAVFS